MSDLVNQQLDRLLGLHRELEGILQTLIINDSTIIDALAQMLGTIQQAQIRAEQAQNRFTQELAALNQALLNGGRAEGSSQAIVVERGFGQDNPELGLLEHLYSYLNDPCAIDVGANVGEVAGRLLATGYSVYAFEPWAPAFAKLLQLRHKGAGNFHPFNCAVGSADGRMELHIAANIGDGKYDASLFHSLVDHPMLDDCKFVERIPVEVRSLKSLRACGEIPPHAGLLKIDTEGFDLEVIRGAGELDYPVVMTEFWDRAHPFGMAGHGSLEATVKEMRGRGYLWHLVVYHQDEAGVVSFYCNRSDSMPKSWGNAIFFREHPVFAAAARWCEQVLRPTIYR